MVIRPFVRLLIKLGKVNANQKDQDRRTPFLWAAENGHEAVVKLLESHLNDLKKLHLK